MKHILAVILGVAASAAGCLVVAAGAVAAVGYARHWLEAWPWLFTVSAVPCALSAWGLSLAAPYTRGHRWRWHLFAILAAFAAVALAGSLGAIVVESANHSRHRVNMAGYLTECWTYAAVLLPITYPLALLVQSMIHRARQLSEAAVT